jgi:hypothetical protein
VIRAGPAGLLGSDRIRQNRGVSVDRPDEDHPDDERARAIIRAFWLEEVHGLRDQHDRQRLSQNLPPIQNQEIAKHTGIPRSTLSDLLTCKRDMVPDWDDRVGLIVDCFGGTTKEWVPKWRTARAAYDSLGKAKSSSATDGDDEGVSQSSGKRRRTWLIVSGVTALVVAVGIGTWWLIPDTNPGAGGPQPATGVSNARCLRVRDETRNVSVFKGPVGDDTWTQWPGKTRFWSVGETTHPNRWRVPLYNGDYGYVGKEGKYVVTANDCH